MFAPLFAKSKLWIMDKEVDCIHFECLFVRSAFNSISDREAVLYLSQRNLEPFLIAAKKGDAWQSRIVKADNGAMDGATYFGRSFQGTACHVTTVTTNSQCGS